MLQFGSEGSGGSDAEDSDPEGEFSSASGPGQVGVDSAGRVYVLDPGYPNYRVQRFTSAGVPDGVLARMFSIMSAGALAVDPAGDHVYVGRSTVQEFDGAGQLVDTHAADAQILDQSITGIGIRASAPVVTVGRDGYDGSANARLYRLGGLSPATLTLQPVSDITSTAATVNATVNPNGAPAVSYQVEYSSDFVTFTTVPVTPVAVGDGTLDVPVSQALAGLDVNTMYAYRFVVKRPYNADVASDYDIFTTAAVAPAVSATVAYPSEQTARLTARINPQGLETTYRFEYGRDSSYGSALPSEPKLVGDGRVLVRVLETVGGLEPATTYHFRVVTSNAAGTTEGPDTTFTTKPASSPSGDDDIDGGRGPFEQVSPVQKDNSDVIPIKTVQLSPSGDGAVFASSGTFAGAQAGVAQGYYAAKRTADNWLTRGLSLAQFTDEAINYKVTLAVSDDQTRAVQVSRVALTPGAVRGNGNLYMQDLRTGALTLMATAPGLGFTSLTDPYGVPILGSSGDFSHLLIASQAAFTPEALTDEGSNYYLWSGGTLRLVSVDENGNAIPAGGPGKVEGHHAVSDDGSRVFYDKRIGASASGVYMWQNGQAKPLSTSQRAGDDPNVVQRATFWAATPNGDAVLFSADHPLTDDPLDRGGLYRYDVGTEHLTLLSPGSNAFNGVYGTTSDLRQVYFSDAGHVAGTTTPPPGAGSSVYVARRDGTIRRVVSLDSSGLSSGFDMSPSGRFASLGSHGFLGFDEQSDRCLPDPAAGEETPAGPA